MALVDNAWYVNYGDGSTTGYYALTKWAASASKLCGNIVRQNAAPTFGNERCFVCVASTGGTGQTGAAEPTWTVTRGAKITDNTVTWQEATGVAALNGDLTNTPTWNSVKNTSVTLGQVIQSNDGTKILICTTAGTAGNGAEPSWAAFTNAGATTVDSTVTWTTIGSSFSAWAAPHARLANAFAANWGQAGNTFFVGDNHAEVGSSTSNTTLTSPGTAASPCYVYSVDHTAAVPPSGAVVKSGANILSATSGGQNIVFQKYAYYKSITVTMQSTGAIQFGSSGTVSRFDDCSFVSSNSGTTFVIKMGFATGGNSPNRIDWNNCTVTFAWAGQSMGMQGGEFRWCKTPSAINGTLPTTLFTAFSSGGMLNVFEGVDFSALGSGKTLVSAMVAPARYVFKDCKLGASVTVAATPTDINGARTDVIRSDSAGTNYRCESYQYGGTHTTETSIVRTGGASDGTTAISWKLATTANARWIFPLEAAGSIAVWNNTVGSSVTVTVEGTINAGAVPNNDDIWIEVEYLGDSASPQGSLASGTKSNGLASGSALTSSASTWGGGGSGAGWSPFKMSVTVTPQQKGYIYVYVKAAKPSTTFYVDPLITLS